MKKWLKYLAIVSLLLMVLSPLTVLAKETNEVLFEADENSYNVKVTVVLPKGLTGTITSLRFQMYVDQLGGEEAMKAPEFAFAPEISSYVKDALVTKREIGDGYIIDVVLSGKADQAIFKNTDTAVIGTITVDPGVGKCYAEVGMVPETDEADSLPVVEYVDAAGVEAMKAHITYCEPVKAGTPPTQTGGTPGTGGTGSEGEDPGFDDGGDTPGGDTGNEGEIPGGSTGEEGETPGTGEGELPSKPDQPVAPETLSAPTLMVKSEVGSKTLTFTWTKVEGASGYVISQLNAVSKVYTPIATIADPNVTTFTKTGSYGETYSFCMKSYRDASGTSGRLDSEYGNVAEVTIPSFDKSVKTTLSAVTPIGKNKVALSWKKVEGAEGYCVYSWNFAKNAEKHWVCVKTIKDPSQTSLTVTKYLNKDPLGYGKTYWFTVSAYAKNSDGKKIEGAKCARVEVTTPPVQPKTVTVKSSKGKVTVSWLRINKAAGYRVYRSTSKNGKYTLVKTITSGTTLKYTDSSVKKGKTYYYKVRAFAANKSTLKVNEDNMHRSYGEASTARKIKVK